MTFIFNSLGLIQIGLVFLTGTLVIFISGLIGLSKGVQGVIYTITGLVSAIVIMILFDLSYRLNNVKREGGKWHSLLLPNKGGHIFLIPSFIIGIFMVIMGLVELFKKLF